MKLTNQKESSMNDVRRPEGEGSGFLWRQNTNTKKRDDGGEGVQNCMTSFKDDDRVVEKAKELKMLDLGVHLKNDWTLYTYFIIS